MANVGKRSGWAPDSPSPDHYPRSKLAAEPSPVAPFVRQVIAASEPGHSDEFIKLVANVIALNGADEVLVLLVELVKSLDALPQDRAGELLGRLSAKRDQAIDGVTDNLPGLTED